MKEYRVRFKQTVEGYIDIQADTKVEAKEVSQSLIDCSKVQHLIQEVDKVECAEFNVGEIEEL